MGLLNNKNRKGLSMSDVAEAAETVYRALRELEIAQQPATVTSLALATGLTEEITQGCLQVLELARRVEFRRDRWVVRHDKHREEAEQLPGS